jgi:glycosyltransferase involved in cell wall biosynthesis
MKIALFHNVPPSGALRAVRELTVRLAAQHEVTVFTVDLGAADRYPHIGTGTAALDMHAPVRQGTLSGRWSRLTPLPDPVRSIATIEAVRQAETALAAEIGDSEFDVAFVWPSVYTQSPPLLERLAIPSLYYVAEPRRRWHEGAAEPKWHGDRPKGMARFDRARYPYDWLNARRDARAVAAASFLTCDSYFTAEAIERAYQRSAPVCYLGVDTDVFSPPVSTSGGASARPSVLTVGAVEAIKGQDLVVEALGTISPTQRPVLHLAFERAHGPYLEYIRRRASDVDVEVHEHREVTDSELAMLYAQADLSVCASRLEPFGLTPLESMACGTPVVAVAQGGYRETVRDGVNGVLVDRQVAALAKGITRVLEGNLRATPDDLRAGIIDQWSWDRATTRITNLLEQAVEL